MSKEEQKRNKEMKALRDKGKSLQEIANIHGVSKERVRQIIGNTGRIYMDKTSGTTWSSLDIGTTAELMVSNKLKKHGIKHTLTPAHTSYDILLENGIKLEVKSAYRNVTPNNSARSHTYKFLVKKNQKGDYCDFFVFYIYKTNSFFVVPNSEIRTISAIYITDPCPKRYKPKWHDFKDRFDLLNI
jgi:hypothetical protein